MRLYRGRVEKGKPLPFFFCLSPGEARKHYSRNSDLKSEYTRCRFTSFPNSNLSAPIAARDVRAGPVFPSSARSKINGVLSRARRIVGHVAARRRRQRSFLWRTPYADIERRCVEAIMLARKTSTGCVYVLCVCLASCTQSTVAPLLFQPLERETKTAHCRLKERNRERGDRGWPLSRRKRKFYDRYPILPRYELSKLSSPRVPSLCSIKR